jgi:hypothetical protein
MPDVLVYNPHDSMSKFTYRGTDFAIEPNKVTKLTVPAHLKKEGVTAETLAGHAVATVGMWGVCILSGDAKADAPRKQRAEQTYLRAMRGWCEDKLLAYEEEMTPRRKAGLRDLEPSKDVSLARRWLEKRGFVKSK